MRKTGEVDGIERVRFMTSHPKDFGIELIKVINCENNNIYDFKLNYPYRLDGVTRNHEIILFFKKESTYPRIVLEGPKHRLFHLNFITSNTIRFLIQISSYGSISNVRSFCDNK